MTPMKRSGGPAGYVPVASAIPACHQGSGLASASCRASATASATGSGCGGSSSSSTAGIYRLQGPSLVRGIRAPPGLFTPSGDSLTHPRDPRFPVMRHPSERKHMLRWNSKLTFVVLVALLVALAAVVGNFSWALLNFSW